MDKFRTKKVREYYMRGAADWRGFVLEKSHDGATWSITPKLLGGIAGSIAGEGLSLDEVEARLTEEMTEEQANAEGFFDCPTCGRLRDASQMTRGEVDEWAASRGVKILRSKQR